MSRRPIPQMPRIVLALIASMVTMGMPAQEPERTQLVLGIMVDSISPLMLQVKFTR